MKIKLSDTKKIFLLGLGGVILMFFLAVNVVSSQLTYSPLMFRMMNMNDIDAAREFLANIKGAELYVYSPNGTTETLYDAQSRYLNSHFDNIFAREVDVTRLNAEKAISRYEELLALNPNNPQVLLKLSLLYDERGFEDKAIEYRAKALSIDPWIERE